MEASLLLWIDQRKIAGVAVHLKQSNIVAKADNVLKVAYLLHIDKIKIAENQTINSYLWCPEQDSNLHASRHAHLKRARLPFRHLGIGFGSAKVESFFDMTKFLWVFLFCNGSFYALGSFEQNPRASMLGRKCSLIPALFVSLWLIITKILVH